MVRVLIDRHVSEGVVEDYRRCLREMRQQAMHEEGYISGESLRDAADGHHFVVISTWTSRAAWEAWAASEARLGMMARVAPLLEEPERVTVLEPV